MFPRELLGSSDWLADRWAKRDAISDVPALLLWGLRDPAFGEAGLHRWLEVFTDARAVGYDDAGHYVQEEAGPKMVAEVRTFLEAT